MSFVTALWNKLHDRYYWKRELYDMAWEKDSLDLNQYIVAGATYGGPVALVRDEKKIVLLGSSSLKPTISIFTSAGVETATWIWGGGRIVKMGWSDKERLVVVLADGSVFVYSLHGELLQEFNMGKEARDNSVIDCCIWGTGLVVITAKTYQLYLIADLDEPTPERMPDAELSQPPTAMCIIEPRFTRSSGVEVLVATAEGTIVVVDKKQAQDQFLNNGPFSRMAVSPDGKCLACFTQQGFLFVLSTDFNRNLSEFETKSSMPPAQLVWCGRDSAVLYWDKILLMVGPYGDWVKYSYDEPVHLIPEIDGLRIISNSKCEFLQLVTDKAVSIFKIGSCAPAALLHDARELFDKKDSKADENIRQIKPKLAEAVDGCIEAAAHEFDVSQQTKLLKSATYGKAFCEFYNSDNFVEMCKTLRVLNTLRDPKIGFPITIEQYQRLTPAVLLDRLINRHHHLLALRICDYLSMRSDKVLIHWACAKVTAATATSASDEHICDTVVQKLRSRPGISYAEIASTAYRRNRPRLATLLLDHEPRAADQVPLLISMQEDEVALMKAIEGGDTDLIHLALLHIKRKRPLPEFLRIILQKDKVVARDLFIAYSKDNDLELLKTFYYAQELPHEAGVIGVLEAYKAVDLNQRKKMLETAMDLFSQSRDYQFMAKTTEEQIKLLDVQKELEVMTGDDSFIDSSLSETIIKCFVLSKTNAKLAARALKIKNDFKLTDKRWWWLKCRGLASGGEWQQLEKFSKEKKPPIGFKPFVEVCIVAGNIDEAHKYCPKVTDLNERAELYMRMGSFREAADCAIQLKDGDLLGTVRSKCSKDAVVAAYVDHLAASNGFV